MASVYILYSKRLGKFYTGSCKILSERLQDHKLNYFKNSFTAKADDWLLFFHLDGLDYSQARKIEYHIKKMKSKVYIQNLKVHPEISAKLIDKYK